MKMIVGLGNPGHKYEGSKHNIGFATIDYILDQLNIEMTDQKFQADYTIYHNDSKKVLFVKPFTYMNLSGEAVLPLMSYYGIGMDDLLIIYDDLDLDIGKLRLREKGGSGGHNGLKSINQMLGSQEYKRIRIGIGRPDPGWNVVDHVLAPFKKVDVSVINEAIDTASRATIDWIQGKPFIDVMSQYN